MSDDSSAPEQETEVDEHEVGLVPKFLVSRFDGRDRKGEEYEERRQGYFVLDIVGDPIARQAYALYALLADAGHYHALAEDMRANLRSLSLHFVATDETTPIRAIATWTYPQAPNHAYIERVGYDASKALTVAEKAALDAEAVDTSGTALVDLAGWANDDVVAVLNPDA